MSASFHNSQKTTLKKTKGEGGNSWSQACEHTALLYLTHDSPIQLIICSSKGCSMVLWFMVLKRA